MAYDSTPDTLEHIEKVRDNLTQIIEDLQSRRAMHDKSKLEPPEKEMFDRVTPLLEEQDYDSSEYRETLKSMGAGLAHHYGVNDHHPEHFHGGINSMNMIQLLEMLADWKAATERHPNGSLERSLDQNRERFNMSDELYALLKNTILDLGWI